MSANFNLTNKKNAKLEKHATSHKLLTEVRDELADALKLPTLELVKNKSLGLMVGSANNVTYFVTNDQSKWRASYNPKRVFDKFDSLMNKDHDADSHEKAKAAFQTFFQSVTAPVTGVGAKFKIVVIDEVAPTLAPAETLEDASRGLAVGETEAPIAETTPAE
jgi:hypothetical protein